MQRGRYGNLTPAALARSQYISPGLLRQQHARRVYPNTSTSTTIQNSTKDDINSAWTSIKKATSFNNRFRVPEEDEPEHGGQPDTLLDRTANAKKSKGVNMACFADASDDSENEDPTDIWAEFNRKGKELLSEWRDDDRAVGEDRVYTGGSSDDGRPVHRGRTHAARRYIPQSQTSDDDSDQLLENDNMETEEVQEDCRPVDTSIGDKKGEKKKGRGKNKCKKVAKLKAGEKIKVTFYNKRALSNTFSRQLGRIVRDLNITPIRVKKWTDISPAVKKHIFDAIKDKFDKADGNIEIDIYKDDIMEHARDLWNNWRGDLNRHYVKPATNMKHAIKNCPKEIPKSDWEWLVKEHFYSKDFKATSNRNSKNRSNLKFLHYSGSKPYRQIIWDNGGNEGNPPTLDMLFSITHTKDGTFMDSETSNKHAEIQEERLLNPSLSNVELADKCFPSNRRDHVVGYGGGIKARDLRSLAVMKAELIAKIKQSEQQRQTLQEDYNVLYEEHRRFSDRVSCMEEEWAQMKKRLSANCSQHESPGSPGARDQEGEDYQQDK